MLDCYNCYNLCYTVVTVKRSYRWKSFQVETSPKLPPQVWQQKAKKKQESYERVHREATLVWECEEGGVVRVKRLLGHQGWSKNGTTMWSFLPHKWELKSRRESVKIIDKPKKVEKNFRGRTACETTFKRKSKEKACLLEFGLHEDLELWRIRKKLERIEDPERVWLWEAVAMKNGGGSKADEAMQGEKIKKNH